jgi:crotonobetainyl-CoA:carnitine CoA-transferase CaiB-like acyl-CoA transferase
MKMSWVATGRLPLVTGRILTSSLHRLDHAIANDNSRLEFLDQVVAHPQTEALGIVQASPDGSMSLVGLPVSFNGTRPPLRMNPPALGADNDLVLGKRK